MTFVTGSYHVIVDRGWSLMAERMQVGGEEEEGEGLDGEENLNVQRISWKLFEDQKQQSI